MVDNIIVIAVGANEIINILSSPEPIKATQMLYDEFFGCDAGIDTLCKYGLPDKSNRVVYADNFAEWLVAEKGFKPLVDRWVHIEDDYPA